MTVESDLRTLLLDDAALVAVVPPNRISVDAVAVEQPRPYIVFAMQPSEPIFGLGNVLLADTVPVDIQIVGVTRQNAIVIRELVKDALLAAGVPWSATSSGFDPENGIEAEVVTLQWLT